MSLDATSLAGLIEGLLILGGLLLGLQLVLRPASRRAPALLPAWDITLNDFFLLLWLVLIGGFAGQFGLNLLHRIHPLDRTHLAIFGTAAFHGGMLLGMVGHRLIFARASTRLPLAFSGSLLTGLATFLIALPVVTLVSLLWQWLLHLCNIRLENQEAIDLLRFTDSLVLRFFLLSLAVLVAPVTEELIFRAGIFRYLRTRVPRWVALLVPALLFASLHLNVGSFVPLMALALVFSLAFERTGNIGTTIFAHALFNLNASALVLLGVNV